MKIALLEDLGVSQNIIAQNKRKLESMGHTFVQYAKSDDPNIQADECRDADAVILSSMELYPQAISGAKILKFIDVAFTGVDKIPVEEAKARGIAISNAAGYATQAVAELCVCFMITLLRNLNKVEQRCRNGGTKEGLIGNELSAKTVGIVGAGSIGKRVAKLCKAFGCTVIAENRHKVDDPNIDEQVMLDELLQKADIISLHVPLTPDTKGLIGYKELALMKKSAFLINTARGPIVDAKALAQALKVGEIKGAACDVFDVEPPLPKNAPLLNCPNIIVTPHIAFATEESLEKRAEIAFENLYSWLDGKQINVV